MDALLSKKFLDSIGVSLDESTYRALEQHSQESLQARIIEAVIDLLDEQQLEDLQALRLSGQFEMETWLQANVPDLNYIIEDEIAILLGDIAESSDKL
ncbi:MAG: hypothetical protein QG649_703 [Patescibacteria group bacterium]|nr:hypothetical protein [Patescibacteria group bacterium]